MTSARRTARILPFRPRRLCPICRDQVRPLKPLHEVCDRCLSWDLALRCVERFAVIRPALRGARR